MFVCYEGNVGNVELKWFWVFRKGAGLLAPALARTYSFVTFWLPSLARSGGILHIYTSKPLGYLGFVADRILTSADVLVRIIQVSENEQLMLH